jgi:hypothetical protein
MNTTVMCLVQITPYTRSDLKWFFACHLPELILESSRTKLPLGKQQGRRGAACCILQQLHIWAGRTTGPEINWTGRDRQAVEVLQVDRA